MKDVNQETVIFGLLTEIKTMVSELVGKEKGKDDKPKTPKQAFDKAFDEVKGKKAVG